MLGVAGGARPTLHYRGSSSSSSRDSQRGVSRRSPGAHHGRTPHSVRSTAGDGLRGWWLGWWCGQELLMRLEVPAFIAASVLGLVSVASWLAVSAWRCASQSSTPCWPSSLGWWVARCGWCVGNENLLSHARSECPLSNSQKSFALLDSLLQERSEFIHIAPHAWKLRFRMWVRAALPRCLLEIWILNQHALSRGIEQPPSRWGDEKPGLFVVDHLRGAADPTPPNHRAPGTDCVQQRARGLDRATGGHHHFEAAGDRPADPAPSPSNGPDRRWRAPEPQPLSPVAQAPPPPRPQARRRRAIRRRRGESRQQVLVTLDSPQVARLISPIIMSAVFSSPLPASKIRCRSTVVGGGIGS